MNYAALVGSVTIIHLLALISPGPDFIMAVRNSLTYSRKTGIWTAFGFGAGITVHIFYSLAGIALVISNSLMLFNIIKYLGAAYLVYIGFKSLVSRSAELELGDHNKKKDLHPAAAFRIGFITNILNPKATLFFLSLFSLVIDPDTPLPVMGIISSILVGSTVTWFSLVAIFMTQKKIRAVFVSFQGIFNKLLGLLLIGFGIKIAFF